jgi:uncharacterized MAPEG superfamily protein
MQTTALALTGFIAWYLFLYLAVAAPRVMLAVQGKRAPNSFKPDGSDVSELAGRICRAHANCYESFAFIGGVMLLAIATGSTDITNGLALVLLGSRLVQSIVHIASGSPIAAQVRFSFFIAQYAIAAYWTVLLICKFCG